MEISKIKSRLRIMEVLDHYGLQPDRNNRLLCPWHDDKTPSLQIYPKTNTWTCFSSKCDAGSGDVIEFIQRMDRLSKHEALVKATELAGGQAPGLNRQAILTKYYQGALHSMQRSKKGRVYAASRSLDHQRLGIGYCSYEVGKTWSEELKAQAKKLGLHQLKNCLVFATKDQSGGIVSLYGRAVSASARSRHFYLSGGFKGLYPGWPAATTRTLIMCESIIDTATLLHYPKMFGPHTAMLALYGTNGFTADHEQAIGGLPELEEVILFFDGDEAGRDAAGKTGAKLKSLCPRVRITQVTTLEGEDINSLVVSHDLEAAQLLHELIEARNPLEKEGLFFSTESSTESKKLLPTGVLNTDNPDILTYQNEGVVITILGGIKITGLDRLRVTLKVERMDYGQGLPVRYSLDLYHAKQVEQLVGKMSERLELGSSQAERIISQLTGALEQYRQEKLELLKPKKEEGPVISEAEKTEALKYLKSKGLLRNTLYDLTASGIVGERQNSLIAYLAYTSRKRERPLHIMYLGASGSGKTYLQEKVSALMPSEDTIEITSLSDNALYYFQREELKGKLILIEDLDGAENVLYPLRELQSKRRISKTVTLKDNKGNLKTVTLRVEGPVSVSGCTTRERLYEDNANRCLLLYIDGSAAQDGRIMDYQRGMSSGRIDTVREQAIKSKLQNVQRLLRCVGVINPYADLIDLPPQVFKPRRTLLLLLSFIETITFYHQYQRTVKQDKSGRSYVLSTVEDIKAAFSLMKPVLFSKSDELTQAARTFLERLKTMVKPDEVFTAKAVRQRLRLPVSTLKRYLAELVRYDYLRIKSGSAYRGYEYQINNYEEYEQLKSSIDDQLQQILSKIENKA
jgi:DNA primase